MQVTQSGNSTNVTGNNMTEEVEGGISDWSYQESIPASCLISGRCCQRQLTITGPEGGRLDVQGSCFDDFLISQMTINVDEPASCTLEGKGDIVALYFNLTGDCYINPPNHDQSITSGEHTIYYSADFSAAIGLIPQDGEIQTLEINIPVPYYERLLSGYSSLQDDFITRMENGIQGQLQPGMLPITMPMKWIINTIRQNRRSGVLKRLFLEAKILELLMLQVEQAEIRESQIGERAARATMAEALYEAKSILEKSLVHPPTIRNLAKMVGLNEFSLKKGFREMFQETIYGFVSKARMQQAREILLEGNLSIHEVSLLAGYKNPQHFTAAFKKHYGVPPSKVVRERNPAKGTSFP